MDTELIDAKMLLFIALCAPASKRTGRSQNNFFHQERKIEPYKRDALHEYQNRIEPSHPHVDSALKVSLVHGTSVSHEEKDRMMTGMNSRGYSNIGLSHNRRYLASQEDLNDVLALPSHISNTEKDNLINQSFLTEEDNFDQSCSAPSPSALHIPEKDHPLVHILQHEKPKVEKCADEDWDDIEIDADKMNNRRSIADQCSFADVSSFMSAPRRLFPPDDSSFKNRSFSPQIDDEVVNSLVRRTDSAVKKKHHTRLNEIANQAREHAVVDSLDDIPFLCKEKENISDSFFAQQLLVEPEDAKNFVEDYGDDLEIPDGFGQNEMIAKIQEKSQIFDPNGSILAVKSFQIDSPVKRSVVIENDDFLDVPEEIQQFNLAPKYKGHNLEPSIPQMVDDAFDELDFPEDGLNMNMIKQNINKNIRINESNIAPSLARLRNLNVSNIDEKDIKDFGVELPSTFGTLKVKKAVYGDGTELDDIKDLPICLEKETKFFKKPSKKVSAENKEQAKENRPITKASIKSNKKTKAPMLIRNVNKNVAVKYSGDMVFNPVKKCWDGNETELDRFDHPNPVRGGIVCLNHTNLPIQAGNMILDPVTQKWIGNDDETADWDFVQELEQGQGEKLHCGIKEFQLSLEQKRTLREYAKCHHSMTGRWYEFRHMNVGNESKFRVKRIGQTIAEGIKFHWKEDMQIKHSFPAQIAAAIRGPGLMISNIEYFVNSDGSLYLPAELVRSCGILPGSRIICLPQIGQLTVFDTQDFSSYRDSNFTEQDLNSIISFPADDSIFDDLINTNDQDHEEEEEEEEEVQLPSTSTKKKRLKRDPKAPKRNISAYSLFTKHISQQISKEFPEIDFRQRAVIIGSKWKELSEEDRKQFHTAALLDKKRYEEEHNIYLKNKILEQTGHISCDKKKELLGPKAPKRNVSAFSIFTKSVTPQVIEHYPAMTFKDRSSFISQMWKQMKPEQRRTFIDRANDDKNRYEKELCEYLNERIRNGTEIHNNRWKKMLRENLKEIEDNNDQENSNCT